MGGSIMDQEIDWTWIDHRTEALHDMNRRYPDKEEVIDQLRGFRLDILTPYHNAFHMPKRQIAQRSTERFGITEAIRRITTDDEEDPIRILVRFQDEMDDMIAKSDHSKVWVFCGDIYNLLEGFLLYCCG
jgi:hypothetical protein